MFTNISWMEFSILTALILIVYYVYLVWRYPHELKKIFVKEKPVDYDLPYDLRNNDQRKLLPETEPEIIEQKVLPDTSLTAPRSEMDSLIHAVKEAVRNAAKKEFVRQEFSDSLKNVLNDYAQIKDPRIRSSINYFIVSEIEKHDAIALSEEEIMQLWNDDPAEQ